MRNSLINIIGSGSSSSGATFERNFSYHCLEDDVTIPSCQQMVVYDEIAVNDGTELIIEDNAMLIMEV